MGDELVDDPRQQIINLVENSELFKVMTACEQAVNKRRQERLTAGNSGGNTVEADVLSEVSKLTGKPTTDFQNNPTEKFPKEHSNKIWEIIRQRINQEAKSRGEWAGIPMPVARHRLVLEPRYPFQHIADIDFSDDDDDSSERHGKRVIDLANVLLDFDARLKKRNKKCNLPGFSELVDGINDIVKKCNLRRPRLINCWRHAKYNGWVEIWEQPDGKRYADIRYNINRGIAMAMSTLGCVQDAFTQDIEQRAHEKLKELLKPHQYAQYFSCGMFLERSRKSGVTYLFRKLRPTIALKAFHDRDDMKILACLCMHPIGYYEKTWCGALCPTDDVIAHLMLMRGDEHHFWRKSNHHSPLDPEAGM